MAWGARSGLKLIKNWLELEQHDWLNGLGSPFGIETLLRAAIYSRNGRLNGLGSPFGIETTKLDGTNNKQYGLNGLGSPFGIETPKEHEFHERVQRLNGLGSPFGIETPIKGLLSLFIAEAKWPGEPVRDSYLTSARPSCCSSYSHFIDQIK